LIFGKFKVTLFLKKTLSTSIFLDIIVSNFIAFNHYCYYLEQRGFTKDLEQLYRHYGSYKEAIVFLFRKFYSYYIIEYFKITTKKVISHFKTALKENKNDLNKLNQIMYAFEQ
jgi:hypothetical protein